MALAKSGITSTSYSSGTTTTVTRNSSSNGLLVAFIGTNQTYSSTNLPSGWTMIAQADSSAATQSLTIMARKVPAVDPGSWTFTVATGGAGALIAVSLIEISGLGATYGVSDAIPITNADWKTDNFTLNLPATATVNKIPDAPRTRVGYAIAGIYWAGGSVSSVTVSSPWASLTTTPTIRVATAELTNNAGSVLTGAQYNWVSSRASVGMMLNIQDPSILHVAVQDNVGVIDQASLLINPLLLQFQQRVTVTDLPNYYSEIITVGEAITVIVYSTQVDGFFFWFG